VVDIYAIMVYKTTVIMARKRKSPDTLKMKASVDIRIAARRLDGHEQYLALLRQARRLQLNIGAPDNLSDIISKGQSELNNFKKQAKGTISRRRRPTKTGAATTDRCYIFIDECGTYSISSKDAFKAFVIAAVIVYEKDYSKVNEQFKRWKGSKLGSRNVFIHEPDVRQGRGSFFCNRNTSVRQQLVSSLHKRLSSLNYSAVACVVHRPEYLAKYGSTSMDPSLPKNLYLMVLDFLMERIVMILEKQFNGAKASVYAEARGPLEDALLQYEYVRLQIDGTSFISPSWFRYQLSPAITFKTKKDNITGLQIADLIARPCGEKVLNPSSNPERWQECKDKLCKEIETAHSMLGMKIIPWDDKYADVCKS